MDFKIIGSSAFFNIQTSCSAAADFPKIVQLKVAYFIYTDVFLFVVVMLDVFLFSQPAYLIHHVVLNMIILIRSCLFICMSFVQERKKTYIVTT